VLEASHPGGRPVRLLAEDPELYEAVPPDQRSTAVDHCLAPSLVVPVGSWEPAMIGVSHDSIGLLILEGLALRRVGIDERFGAELLGSGDLLRPWDGTEPTSVLPGTTSWRVISQLHLAVLTPRVAERLARFPTLTGALTAKGLVRSRRLALMMAVVHHPRIETRLHMLFWHLADRWGRVRGDGVLLPLRLSHSVLADLIVAQRPSVTGGLGKLAAQGHVRRMDEGWLLCGGPPGELLELQDVSVG
jgi:CRP-like cAMP-binding protein